MTGFSTASRQLPYYTDAAALFDALATKHDSMLLESADIESKKNVQCLAVLDAALKVTCRGQRVYAEVLTPTGQAMLERLEEQLSEYRVGAGEFEFQRPTDSDERRRLKAISNAEVLRKLQLDAGYSHEMLPFLGGGFAYDYLDTFEVLPEVPDSTNEYPDYEFIVAQTVLHVDHLNHSIVIHGVDIDEAALQARLDEHLDKAQKVVDAPLAETTEVAEKKTVTVTDILDKDFREHVATCRRISMKVIFTRLSRAVFLHGVPRCFRCLPQAARDQPFALYVLYRGADYELIGASRINLKFDADTREVQLYPIAGTRPRGATHELDIRNELDMRTDTKELAEHTMLVDLARNDLARVAVPGTRRVADLLQVDRYSRVMHLVSRVVAELHPDFDAIDAYRACMNMGTLTGAPKLRAMELVRDTEDKRRGSYGGAVGYLRGDGSMDNCIVIRSAYIKNDTAIVQAGAGVVRDSVPQSEADETLHKAYAVLHAIAAANNATLEVVR